MAIVEPPTPTPVDGAPPFWVEELTGKKRKIRLTGRALPYRPFSLKSTQRVSVEWLPGSPIGTATVLGATEDPTQLAGAWKAKYLGLGGFLARGEQVPMELDGGAILSVLDAVELWDEILRHGNQIEVRWLDTVRRGFLTSFEKRWLTSHDVEWFMEFTWISRGEDEGPAVFITTQGLDDTSAVMKGILSELDAIETPSNFAIGNGFLDGLASLQQGIEDSIAGIEEQIEGFTNKLTSPIKTTRGIIATLKGIEDEAELMGEYVDGQFGDALNTRDTGPNGGGGGGISAEESVAQQSYARRLEAAQWKAELKAWAKHAARVSVTLRAALVQQIGTDVLGTYIARAGDDLRDVSSKFYNTPFEWRRILTFNGLTSAELRAGQVVFVPKLNPEDAGQE